MRLVIFIIIFVIPSISVTNVNADQCADILKHGIYDNYSEDTASYALDVIKRHFYSYNFQKEEDAISLGFGAVIKNLNLSGYGSNDRFRQKLAAAYSSDWSKKIKSDSAKILIQTVNPQIVRAWEICMTAEGVHLSYQMLYDQSHFNIHVNKVGGDIDPLKFYWNVDGSQVTGNGGFNPDIATCEEKFNTVHGKRKAILKCRRKANEDGGMFFKLSLKTGDMDIRLPKKLDPPEPPPPTIGCTFEYDLYIYHIDRGDDSGNKNFVPTGPHKFFLRHLSGVEKKNCPTLKVKRLISLREECEANCHGHDDFLSSVDFEGSVVGQGLEFHIHSHLKPGFEANRQRHHVWVTVEVESN